MKVYRCWWCLFDLATKGKDCGRLECIEKRRSGPWKKRRHRNAIDHKPQPVYYTQ